MKRGPHRTDELVRLLPLVADKDVRSASDPAAEQALFEEIMTMTTTTQRHEPATAPAPPHRTKHLAALVTGLVTVTATGTAWAVYTNAGSTTATGCHLTEDSVSVVDAVTGRPGPGLRRPVGARDRIGGAAARRV